MARARGLIPLVLLLVLAVGVSIYSLRELWQRDAPAPEARPPEAAAPVAVRSAPAVSSVPTVRPAAVAARGAAPPKALAQRFESATDYLVFARGIHEAAKAGDADAQYYLFRTLHYCHGMFRAYFGRPGKSRTLDEGLRWAARSAPALDVDEAGQVNDRCRSLEESAGTDFGEHDQWLQKAALGGQPNAQAELARALIAGTHDMPAEEARRSRQDAQELMRQALLSRDPEVIAGAGDLLDAVHPGESGGSVAWLLAACARGLDCSASSERTKEYCRYDSNCQPYETLVDMMRRHSPDFPLLEQRSREINRLIDDGDWAALGFGAASP